MEFFLNSFFSRREKLSICRMLLSNQTKEIIFMINDGDVSITIGEEELMMR